ncbi:MAG: GAF domain-containing protein [Anaerolineales bacterium]|jgi:GAF domain-containing protein/HAMP domain-containing protein|nr:GAF domain-containing protein [Anaerolineales bacterium]
MFSFIKTFFEKSFEPSESRNKSIIQISLIGAIAAWLALPAYLVAGAASGEIQYQYLAYNNLALAVGLSIAQILARLKVRIVPIWLTALLVEATFIIANIYLQGLGIILAIILLAIIVNIALQSLPPQPALVMIASALIAAGACVVIDLFNLPAERSLSPFWLQQVVIVFGGLVVLFVGINLLQTLSLRSLRTQLSLAFVFTALLPLITILALSLLAKEQDTREIEAQEISQTNLLLADEVNTQLEKLIRDVESETNLAAVETALSGRESDLLDTMTILSAQDDLILSYGLLDRQGTTLLDTLSFRIGQSQAEMNWYQQTLLLRSGTISEILYDQNLVRPVFYVSAPVFNEAQEITGVLYRQYDADFVRELLLARSKRFDQSFRAMIVDQNQVIVAHTSQPNLHLRTLSPLEDDHIAALQAVMQLPPGTAQSLSAGLTDFVPYVRPEQTGSKFKASAEEDSELSANFSTASIPVKNWTLFAGQASKISTFSVFQDNQAIRIATLVILLGVILSAASTSGVIAGPINSLAIFAKEVGKGNLSISSGISRRDELGTLARAFDETTRQLRNILQNMEARVEERTSELGQANALITQRAEQLKTVSGVARAINNLQNLQLLLPQITEEISASFGYYHVGIFLLDVSGQYAVLQAANSEGGRNMLARGHKLRVGQVGIVGFVTGVGKARIALDVGDDATFFNNPDLPETRSEMALPLKSGSVIIGALDIQSERPAAFVNEDIEVLSLLADQISTAIQNSRLFEETQAALAEAQLIFSKNVKSSWQEILNVEKTAFRFKNGKFLEAEKSQATPDTNEPQSLALPIVIRGQTIGNLNIKTKTKHNWEDQDIRIFQSIVDRLGFALENARLFRNAQRLVSKEQLIGEITDKIGRSVNLDSILQTAVEELGHVIADSEVTIQVGEHGTLES